MISSLPRGPKPQTLNPPKDLKKPFCACRTVFDRPGLHTTFMYNKNDAYINPDDIAYIIGKCKEFGNEADEVLTDTRYGLFPPFIAQSPMPSTVD